MGVIRMEEYYKVFYREGKILKCTRYGYEDEYEAIKVAEYYSQKDGIMDVEVHKYTITSELIRKY